MKKLIAVLTALGILTTGIYMPNNYDSALVSITASAETSSATDFRFNAETGTITRYIGSDTEIVIPSEIDGVAVTNISLNCFTGLNIESITVPNTFTTISNQAFDGCRVKRVVLPDSITKIGYRAFYQCSNLTSIEIPDSVTSIDDYAFCGCSKLTSINIPNSLTNISTCAFVGCSFTDIIISDNIINIWDQAFGHCEKLTSITILNPECKIHGGTYTIYNYRDDNHENVFNGTIYGYAGSTAEVYAEEYGRNFVALEKDSVSISYSNGDVTGDGIIDATDASFILTAYAKSSTNEDDGMNEEQRTFADVNNDDVVDAVDASTVLTYYARSSVDFKGTFEEYLDEFVFKKEINPDDYFKAEIKTHEISKDTYGNENLTIVFEFTNVTDETFYVNDNEIAPNGTWEKRISDKTDRWGSMIKHGGYIHYVFSDSEMNKMFSGGLFFKLDENLDVVESRGFLD